MAVHVATRKNRVQIAGVANGELLVHLVAPPIENRANAELCKLLAKACGVASGRVRVRTGATSPKKVVQIDGLNAEDVAARLTLQLTG